MSQRLQICRDIVFHWLYHSLCSMDIVQGHCLDCLFCNAESMGSCLYSVVTLDPLHNCRVPFV